MALISDLGASALNAAFEGAARSGQRASRREHERAKLQLELASAQQQAQLNRLYGLGQLRPEVWSDELRQAYQQDRVEDLAGRINVVNRPVKEGGYIPPNFAHAQHTLDAMAQGYDDLEMKRREEAFRKEAERKRKEDLERVARDEARRRESDKVYWNARARELRHEAFRTPWNLFRVWLWGLFGVETHEVIRNILVARHNKLRNRANS